MKRYTCIANMSRHYKTHLHRQRFQVHVVPVLIFYFKAKGRELASIVSGRLLELLCSARYSSTFVSSSISVSTA
jgi:hypothetical protein